MNKTQDRKLSGGRAGGIFDRPLSCDLEGVTRRWSLDDLFFLLVRDLVWLDDFICLLG